MSVVLVMAFAALYLADYLSIRLRIPNNREQFDTVQMRPYYAVPQKNHSTEFIFLDPKSEVCVQSLFPQLGYSPCWFVNRHKQKRIDM